MRWVISLILMFSLVGQLKAAPVLLENVAFKAQSPPGDWADNMNCGPTSALMLAAHHWGFNPSVVELRALIDWLYEQSLITQQSQAEYYDGNVTSLWQLEIMLRQYFQINEISRSSGYDLEYIRTQLQAGQPVIVGVNIDMNANQFGHFMMVVGLTDDHVVVHDPGKTYGSYKQYSLNRFHSSWATSNYASLSIEPPQVVWYPNGTLLQVVGSSMVYLVKDNQLYWIKEETVFNAHYFDWQKIIQVDSSIWECFDYGGVIEDHPYYEVYLSNGTYYLYEKAAFIALECELSPFKSEAAWRSWQINVSVNEVESLDGIYGSCRHGATLHFRDGTLIKPAASQSYGAGAVFIATNGGELRPFIDWDVFQLMKFDQLPLFEVTEQELYDGARFFGQAVTNEQVTICSSSGYQVYGGAETDVVEPEPEEDIVSGEEEDVVEPVVIQEELCDGLDNNNNGQIDEDVRRECHHSCGLGWQYCRDGVWQGCEVYDFVEEIEDGIDNDCDGLVDEGFVIPEDADPLDQDNDHDGYSINQGDCDDWSPETNPGQLDICDGFDNNCNFLIDEDEDCGDSDLIECQVSCPADMIAHVWYGLDGSQSGNPVELEFSIEETCIRGQPWFDFNCACQNWTCHDWSLAVIDCNHDIEVHAGAVDYRGEGEVWFSNLLCE